MLSQSPYLSLISAERIQQSLQLMGKAASTPLTTDLAREVCERTGAAAVLEGSISRLGSQYVMGLRANHCRSGDVLDEQQIQAARKEDVLNALGTIAERFRTRAGESLSMVRQHEAPLEQATTPSLEALKAYTAAIELGLSGNPVGQISLLRKAIEIDPDFAMAYNFLAVSYGNTAQQELAAQSARRAYELRNRATDRERFSITFDYDLYVTGNLVSAQRTGEIWARTYPRDRDAHGQLSWIYQLLGDYEKSLEEGKKTIEADPDYFPGPVNTAWAYIFLDRLTEAERTVREAEARKLAGPDLSLLPYYIGFLRNDTAAMQREVMNAREQPDIEDWIGNAEVSAQSYTGRMQEAKKTAERAVALVQQGHEREKAALYEAGSAVRKALFGNAAEAKQRVQAALALSRSRDVEYGAAFALAEAGAPEDARARIQDLEGRFPDDTCVRFMYVPVVRGLLAVRRGEPDKAIDLLQSAAIRSGSSRKLGGLLRDLVPGVCPGRSLPRGATGRGGGEGVSENHRTPEHRFCRPGWGEGIRGLGAGTRVGW